MRASLPMYDWPELRDMTDLFWSEISIYLQQHGISSPTTLERASLHQDTWRCPELVLSQCCGWNVAAGEIAEAQVIARPVWAVQGCDAGHYRSAIITRANEDRPLAELLRCPLINSLNSWSGHRTMQRWASLQGLTLSSTLETGAHRASLAGILNGQGDIAAIDGVCLHLARTVGEADGLKILTWTDPMPSTPFIVGPKVNADLAKDALHHALKSKAGLAYCRATGLQGIVEAKASDYDIMLRTV